MISLVPVGVGNATITAKTKDGKYTATCNVTVNASGDVSCIISVDVLYNLIPVNSISLSSAETSSFTEKVNLKILAQESDGIVGFE